MDQARAIVADYQLSLLTAFVTGVLILPLWALALRLDRLDREGAEIRVSLAIISLLCVFAVAAFSPWPPLWLRLIAMTLEATALGMLAFYYGAKAAAKIYWAARYFIWRVTGLWPN